MALPNHGRLVAILLLAVTGSFAFGFAMVPLYDVFCEITGINGKVSKMAATEVASPIDASRTLSLQFTGSVDARGAWEFVPNVGSVDARPGEIVEATFRARNLSGAPAFAQAIPSIAPGEAAPHVKKFECFCYQKMAFAKGEEKTLKVRFRVDPEVPAEVSTLTLAYTFFTVTETAQAE
jgi:cytochrome c oxidase assembly protein subunit 11